VTEKIDDILECFEIIPVPLSESMGTITGKYSAKDKITSSAVDLLGEESIQRLLHLTDPNNPYRFDLRRGRPFPGSGRGDPLQRRSGAAKARANLTRRIHTKYLRYDIEDARINEQGIAVLQQER